MPESGFEKKESSRLVPIETRSEIVDRVGPLIRPAGSEELSDFAYTISKHVFSHITLILGHSGNPPEGSRQLNPDDTEDRILISDAVAKGRGDDELLGKIAAGGRWFDLANIKHIVERGITDALQIQSGGRILDVLNCSGQALSGQEVEDIQTAFQVVYPFTDGKILDRVKGVVLDNTLKSRGDFLIQTGILRLNIGAS
jgi:hypothetical protein